MGMRNRTDPTATEPILSAMKPQEPNGFHVDQLPPGDQTIIGSKHQDSRLTIRETYRLWVNMDKPKVFLQPPQSTSDQPPAKSKFQKGGQVNISLLFAIVVFSKVVKAYFDEIEKRLSQGTVIQDVNSVASYFVSCIEAMVDPLLETCLLQGGSEAEIANKLLSDIANARTKQACEIYKETFGLDMFLRLEADIERSQRLLWSRICSKNPMYSDVKYLNALIDSEHFHSMPLQTLVVYRAHGESRRRLADDLKDTLLLLERLQQLGISASNYPQREEDQGEDPFQKPFHKLMATITSAGKKR